MRQHVNPLSSYFQLPIDLPGLEELFENPELPIHLDIGSAQGKFLLSMASFYNYQNYLGVEIRKPLVIAAERRREQLGIKNLKFLFCNANVSLENWLSNLPNYRLETVSIQFPDPWFKRRHHKRRVLQPSLLLALTNALKPNCRLFVQSDIKAVIQKMATLIELTGCFNRSENLNGEWLEENPYSVPTERESYVISKGLQVYRALYNRNTKPIPELSKLEESYLDLKNNY